MLYLNIVDRSLSERFGRTRLDKFQWRGDLGHRSQDLIFTRLWQIVTISTAPTVRPRA
jgi:hypothetical protein